mgnify:CR=1 FL=1
MNIVSSIDLIHLLFDRIKERKVRAVAFFYSLWFHMNEYLYIRTMIIVHKICSSQVEMTERFLFSLVLLICIHTYTKKKSIELIFLFFAFIILNKWFTPTMDIRKN